MATDDLRKKMDKIKKERGSVKPKPKKRSRSRSKVGGKKSMVEFVEKGGKWTTRMKPRIKRLLLGDKHKSRRTKQVEAAVRKAE
jgi:hypothetical protein